MKYITESLADLESSYKALEKVLAYQDIVKFLTDEKEKALKKLKLADDPVARATWNLVDKFFERIENINREVRRKQLENQ